MYWLEKYKNSIDGYAKLMGISVFIPFIIWCINGGKNDLGVVHTLVIRMELTVLAILFVYVAVLLLFVLHDVLLWVSIKIKGLG